MALDVYVPRGPGAAAALHLAVSRTHAGAAKVVAAADCDLAALVRAVAAAGVAKIDAELRLDGRRKGHLVATVAAYAPARAS